MRFEMSPEMETIVDEMAHQAGIPQTELLRRAIALLKTVKEAEREGLLPGLIDREGNVKARLVGI